MEKINRQFTTNKKDKVLYNNIPFTGIVVSYETGNTFELILKNGVFHNPFGHIYNNDPPVQFRYYWIDGKQVSVKNLRKSP